MRRLFALLPMLALLFALAGCATAGRAHVDAPESVPGVALQDPVDPDIEPVDKGPSFGDYAMVLPKNVAWVPWKIVAGTVKGLGDGFMASFDESRDPILGLIFSPVNAVVGLLTGFGTGVVSEPVFMGPKTPFGRTMGLPWQRPTPIWWLTD